MIHIEKEKPTIWPDYIYNRESNIVYEKDFSDSISHDQKMNNIDRNTLAYFLWLKNAVFYEWEFWRTLSFFQREFGWAGHKGDSK